MTYFLQHKPHKLFVWGKILKQAGAKLGHAQFKLELEQRFTWIKICCIKLINKQDLVFSVKLKLGISWGFLLLLLLLVIITSEGKVKSYS